MRPAFLAAVIPLVTGAVGCESDAPVRSPKPLVSAAEFGALREPGREHGLEVIQWSAPCDPGRAVQVLLELGRGGTLDPATIERLRRNGLMVAEVPTSLLPEALERLGGTLTDLRHWHGQVPEWRDLLRAELLRGEAIHTGGRVKALGAGSVRLAMRGWSVPMEDGALFWLELLPHAVSRDLASLPAPGRRDRVRGEPFPDAGLSVVLDAGWSLLLCPDSPPSRASTGTSAGPDAEPPRTLGAVLLPAERLPEAPGAPLQERTPVLVFMPRLPESLLPLPLGARPRSADGTIARAPATGAAP